MDNALWAAVMVAAAGTFLVRVLPLLWMQRHLARRNDNNAVEAMPVWLSVLGPSMIAAMLGMSLVPAAATYTAWLATACGVVLTFLVWYWTRSLGWPVFAGVTVYGVVTFLAGIAA